MASSGSALCNSQTQNGSFIYIFNKLWYKGFCDLQVLCNMKSLSFWLIYFKREKKSGEEKNVYSCYNISNNRNQVVLCTANFFVDSY